MTQGKPHAVLGDLLPLPPVPGRGRRLTVALCLVFANGLILTLSAYFILGAFIRDILVQDRTLVEQAVVRAFEGRLEGLEQAVGLTTLTVRENASFPADGYGFGGKALEIMSGREVSGEGTSSAIVRLRPGPSGTLRVQAVSPETAPEWVVRRMETYKSWTREAGERARDAPRLFSDAMSFALVQFAGKGQGYVLGIGDMALWRKEALGRTGLSVYDVDQASGSVPHTSRAVKVAGSSLRFDIALQSTAQADVLEEIPSLILLFGLTLTFIGTLYVSGIQSRSAPLTIMKTILSRKNLELKAEVAHREKLNESIRQAERENRAIIDSVSDIIFETSVEGDFVFLNEAWVRVTGFETGWSVGRSLF
ncbi:MAG TPA: PAS domain-containing protein, partial [Alphaproteobacteria bacterium]|nr:PAS domain-containing protein [Alphaproteobacteria bacterium]